MNTLYHVRQAHVQLVAEQRMAQESLNRLLSKLKMGWRPALAASDLSQLQELNARIGAYEHAMSHLEHRFEELRQWRTKATDQGYTIGELHAAQVELTDEMERDGVSVGDLVQGERVVPVGGLS